MNITENDSAWSVQCVTDCSGRRTLTLSSTLRIRLDGRRSGRSEARQPQPRFRLNVECTPEDASAFAPCIRTRRRPEIRIMNVAKN